MHDYAAGDLTKRTALIRTSEADSGARPPCTSRPSSTIRGTRGQVPCALIIWPNVRSGGVYLLIESNAVRFRTSKRRLGSNCARYLKQTSASDGASSLQCLASSCIALLPMPSISPMSAPNSRRLFVSSTRFLRTTHTHTHYQYDHPVPLRLACPASWFLHAKNAMPYNLTATSFQHLAEHTPSRFHKATAQYFQSASSAPTSMEHRGDDKIFGRAGG